jgi:hypothetical protein
MVVKWNKENVHGWRIEAILMHVLVGEVRIITSGPRHPRSWGSGRRKVGMRESTIAKVLGGSLLLASHIYWLEMAKKLAPTQFVKAVRQFNYS